MERETYAALHGPELVGGLERILAGVLVPGARDCHRVRALLEVVLDELGIAVNDDVGVLVRQQRHLVLPPLDIGHRIARDDSLKHGLLALLGRRVLEALLQDGLAQLLHSCVQRDRAVENPSRTLSLLGADVCLLTNKFEVALEVLFTQPVLQVNLVHALVFGYERVRYLELVQLAVLGDLDAVARLNLFAVLVPARQGSEL